MKIVNLGPKMPYLGFFRLTFERKLLLYLKQPRILQNAKLHAELKILKFGTKYALFGYFWAEILKNIVIFEVSALECVYLQCFVRKSKFLNLEQKWFIWVFWVAILKKTS